MKINLPCAALALAESTDTAAMPLAGIAGEGKRHDFHRQLSCFDRSRSSRKVFPSTWKKAHSASFMRAH